LNKNKIQAIRPQKIVEARFDLTAKQNDILDIVFSKVKNDNKLEYEINLYDYIDIYHKGDTNAYRDFKNAVLSFKGKGFNLSLNGNDKTFMVWFQRITYDANGCITVVLNSELHDIFVKMKEKDLDENIKKKDKRIYYFIKYPMNFKSIYSKRFYCYLKSFEDTKWRIDSLEDLRKKLECENSYSEFRDFKRYVIRKAQEEINKSSDIYFDYETIIEKRKVCKIKFIIKKNPNKNIKEIKLTEEQISATKDNSELDILVQQVQDIITKKYINI
jgi:plasmid replication initiation protein